MKLFLGAVSAHDLQDLFDQTATNIDMFKNLLRADFARQFIFVNHATLPSQPSHEGLKDADTKGQKGSELDAKIAPQGVANLQF
jgi:hypothetical protein